MKTIMDRIKNLVLYTFIFVSLLLNISSLIIYRRISVLKDNLIANNNNKSTKQNVSLLTKTVYDSWENDGLKFNSHLLYRTPSKDSIMIKNFFSNNKVLICRISELYCSSCVEYVLDIIESLSNDTSFKMKIMILGQYNDLSLKILQQQHSFGNDVLSLSIEDSILPLDKYKYPYLCKHPVNHVFPAQFPASIFAATKTKRLC